MILCHSISGGELFERVVADDFTLTEMDSILFMRQISEGVEYMHQNNVVHLDLKVRSSVIGVVDQDKIFSFIALLSYFF